MRTARAVALLLLLATVFLAPLASASQGPGAKALEARLLAPCCWGGTLDIHDSAIAHDLRQEIESRIGRGESADVIEADLVDRFGPRIRAMSDENALSSTVIALFAAIGGGALGLAFLIRRWRARAVAGETKEVSAARDGFDDRLDAELAAFED